VSWPEVICVGECLLEPDLDRLQREGREIKLEPRVTRLLLHLIKRAGHNVTVEELLEHVWPDVVVGPDSVYQAIALLRRKLGDDLQHPRYIAHIPRRGYRFIADVNTLRSEQPAASAPPAAAARVTTPPRAVFGGWGATIVALVLVGTGALAVGALRSRHAPAPAVAAIEMPPRVAVAPPPSIAVLPFLDLSEKRDLGYFADGMVEELIDRLSHMAQLRVPARTSSFYFKDRPQPLAEIGRALNVANVLEGSVRRSGQRLRVTAQLIRVEDGSHLWSQSYDRDATDVLLVEDDIARSVVHALRVRLLAGRSPDGPENADGQTHNLLLQCQFYMYRNTAVDADRSVECFRQLVRLDAAAPWVWSGYARVLFSQPVIHGGGLVQRRAAAAQALLAAQHALRLDPGLAEAHAVIATIRRAVDHDWQGAQAEVLQALAADPDDPASLMEAAALARDLGQFTAMIDYCQRAQARDPLNFVPYLRMALAYLYLGKLQAAETAARRRIELSPEGYGGYLQLTDVLLAEGKPQDALAAARQERSEDSRLVGLALAYHALGRAAQADQALHELRAKYGPLAQVEIAEVLAFRGETAAAFGALESALRAQDPGIFAIKSDSYFKPLQQHPRYLQLLRKLNLPS
jgi:TolB-like protein/DNA-binding winged helix-turn-helix (wHTH) protein/tetratricopeptide (TPR) repeat protein